MPHYNIDHLHERIGDLAHFLANRYDVEIGITKEFNTYIECPIHQPGHTTSAVCRQWSDSKWTFNCFRCDTGALDIIDLFVELHEARDRGEAIRKLAAITQLPANTRGSMPLPTQAQRRTETRKPEPEAPAKSRWKPLPNRQSRSHVDHYRKERQWKNETVDALQLHAVGLGQQLRIRHPFLYKGQIVASQDRATSGTKPKWLTGDGRTDVLYNVEGLDQAESFENEVFVCEGLPDAITLLDIFGLEIPVVGVPGASLWKSNWSEALHGLTVIVIADNDEAGHRMRSKVAHELSELANAVDLYVPEPHNDITDWRLASGDQFVKEFNERWCEAADSRTVTQ